MLNNTSVLSQLENLTNFLIDVKVINSYDKKFRKIGMKTDKPRANIML